MGSLRGLLEKPSRRLIFTALLAFVMALVAVAGTPGGSQAALDSEEQAFVTLINSHRQANGLGSLSLDSQLNAAADWMSNDMAANDYFSHTDSLGRDPFQRMADFGYNYNTWKGEILAAGVGVAQAAFDVFKNSPGHNSDMLNANFKVIGIARAYGAGTTYGWYWTTDFGGQGWENLGGVLNSGPDVSSWAEGRLDVFALDTDNKLRHKWYAGGRGWSGWENLGAPTGLTLDSDPSAVSWGEGRIDVFATASDKALWHRWYVRGQGWSGWENLHGVLNSGPDVSTWAEGRLDIFALGTDDKLRHKWYVRGRGWSGWENLGAPSGLTLTADPGAVSWGGGRIDVFARASDNGLWHRWFVRGKGWSGWESLGGVLNSGPDVSSLAKGSLDVFALGTDDKLRHKWYVRGQGWFPQGLWENLGAPSGRTLTSDPGVVSWADCRIDAFGRASDGGLWHKWYR